MRRDLWGLVLVTSLGERLALIAAGGALHLAATAANFDQHATAFGARLGDRLVPGDEVALRVALTAIELSPLLGSALHDLALVARRALHTDLRQERLGVPALREGAARHELPETSELDDHRRAALLADLVGRLVADLHLLHGLLGLLQRLRKRAVELLQRRHPLPFA